MIDSGKIRTDRVNRAMADVVQRLRLLDDPREQIMVLAGALDHVEHEQRLGMFVDAFDLFTSSDQ